MAFVVFPPTYFLRRALPARAPTFYVSVGTRTIHCVFIRRETAAYTLLYSHGNAEGRAIKECIVLKSKRVLLAVLGEIYGYLEAR
jgi:hypothetical protein